MDLIEQGSPEREPAAGRSRALLAGVVALAVGGLLVHRAQGPDGDDARVGRPLAVVSASPSTGTGRATGAPLPERDAACGSRTLLPTITAPTIEGTTGLQLLVGALGLRRLTVDSGRLSAVSGLRPGDDRYVTGVVPAARGWLVLSQRCSDVSSYTQSLLRLSPDLTTLTPATPARADAVVTGTGGLWSVDYPTGFTQPPLVHSLDSSATARLPAGFAPYATTPGGFLGSSAQVDTTPAPAIQVASGRSGTPGPALARGTLLAVTGTHLVALAPCEPAPRTRCQLLSGTVAGPLSRTLLPPGRLVTFSAALSPDGSRAAFVLTTAGSVTSETAAPPSQIAVVDLRTHRVSVLRGVSLPSKSQPGLSWSRDGHWLLLGLNQGDAARVLVWRSGWDSLRLVPTVVPGPVLYAPTVVDVTGR